MSFQYLQNLIRLPQAAKIFNEFQAILETIPDTIEYVENEKLMTLVNALRQLWPELYDEFSSAAHLEPEAAIDRLNALYPGADVIRTYSNYPRLVSAIQLLIRANERREKEWRASSNTSPLKALSTRRKSKLSRRK